MRLIRSFESEVAPSSADSDADVELCRARQRSPPPPFRSSLSFFFYLFHQPTTYRQARLNFLYVFFFLPLPFLFPSFSVLYA